MHILVLTPVFPHASSPVEALFIAQNVDALAAAGARVTVVVAKPRVPEILARAWRRYRPLSRLPAHEQHGTVQIIYSRYLHVPRLRLPELTVASCARSILATLRRQGLEGSFDLIHAHNVWPVGMASPTIGKSLGIPFVVTAHIRDDERLYSSGQGARLYREMLRRTAAMAAVGSPLVRFLKGFEEPQEVARIPNGVDLEMARAVASQNRVDGAWGKLVSVSNLWPVKGVDYNLKALAELARREVGWRSYTVVGDGPERGRLESLAQELGIADRVEFTGRLLHRSALERVAEADIFSLPSWQEAFGVVYLEAMACGKPVIGCRGQGAGDLIRNGVDGSLVEPQDVETLVDALERLLTDETFARSLGASGARRAGSFTWESNAARYLQLYEGVRDATD